jgi:hypothetical protein
MIRLATVPAFPPTALNSANTTVPLPTNAYNIAIPNSAKPQLQLRLKIWLWQIQDFIQYFHPMENNTEQTV